MTVIIAHIVNSLIMLFTGAFSVYGRVQVVLWWVSHTSVLTYGVFRPLKYQMASNLGRLRYVHIGLLVAGIILPLIPTLIHWFVGVYGVDVVRNYTCIPGDILPLENLPFAIFGTVTLVMFMLIASKIYQMVSMPYCVILCIKCSCLSAETKR